MPQRPVPAARATLQALDATALWRWCAAGRAGLADARAEIDDLNVYPVPDGDTGTNLLLTMEAVEAAVEQACAETPDDLPGAARAMARGALMGARGNSGVILSQLLRGLADVLAADDRPGESGGARLRRALVRAAETAYEAVTTPVEGTLLTVAREAAEATAAVVGSAVDELAEVARAARAGAAASLLRTPSLLPQLAAAGVVDAGGRGLCVLLEALERVVTGSCAAEAELQLLVPRSRAAGTVVREDGSDAFGYEVQYLLRDTDDAAVEALRTALAPLGDSLLVVGGDGLFNVHVHVNDVGAAVEAGIEAGRPFRVTVTRFADQAAEAIRATTGPRLPAGRTLVAVAAGEGLAALFTAAGALVVPGGPGASPSTAELLAAVRRGATAEVVLLPNDPNTLAVASAAAATARDEGFSVAVVPTRSVLQGLAAVAVADPERSFADDVANMAEAAGSTHHGEVTVAVREAATSAGVCHPGDVLGLIEDDVVLLGRDVEQTGRDLLQRMLAAGGELVTVVTGRDAEPNVGQRLVDWVEQTFPLAEAVAYEGGQDAYPLLLGVE